MNFVPHDYQAYTINYIETHPVAAVLLDMGLGKTVISLTAIADLLFDSFVAHRVLVIAPLRVARDTSSATLNLTLSDGTATGAVPVYINGTTRCSTHVAVGNITLMTYRENTPINGSGSYTGWWINRNQDTTTNYYDRINYKASVTAVGAIAAGRLG